MPKTEHSPAAFVSWEGESWDILCIIALTIMHYANTKVGTSTMKLTAPSKYAMLYIWSVLSVSV